MGKPQNGDLQLSLAIIYILTRVIRKSTLGTLSQGLYSKLFGITVYFEAHIQFVVQSKFIPTEATYYDKLI